jgi:thiol-disulfide isomerase/thioredoxin
MLKKSLIFISIISALLFQACSSESKEKEVAESLVSTNEYVLTGLDNKQYVVKKEGNGFVLEGAEGKVVMFDIFATWCPPCRKEATHLTALSEKYKGKFIVIGSTIEDNIPNEKLIEFRKTYNAQYILVNSSENKRLNDAIVTELKLGERYPIPTMAMYLDGKLINHYVGATEEEFIDSDIKRALGL